MTTSGKRSILVLHGPNLGALGRREPAIYGTLTLAQVNASIEACAAELEVSVEIRQTNHEGVLVDWLLDAPGRFDGVVANPGGYAHTSVVLRDAFAAAGVPVVEVHLTNVHAREPFRASLVTAGAAVGVVSGFGERSYALGLRALIDYLNTSKSA